MRQQRPKQPRKYNPVRFVDPQDIHVARVHPRQSIKLILSPPEKWGDYVSEDAKYCVKIDSPYLILHDVVLNKNGQEVYIIHQKYDLARYEDVSEFFLGEIRISLEGNTHPKADECRYAGASLCVYHNGCKNVVTTIDPDNYTVQIEPDQTLEVICTEPSWLNAAWEARIDDIDVVQDNEQHYVHINQCERHILSVHEGRNKIGDLRVVPRTQLDYNPFLTAGPALQSQMTQNVKLHQQHHFWFKFTGKSVQGISSLRSNRYYVANITFTGKNGSITQTRKLNVLLSKHGKPKKIKKSKMNSYIDERIIRHASTEVLCNPAHGDRLEFTTNQPTKVVEIAVPNAFWPDEPKEQRWMLEEVNAANQDYLDFKKLDDLERGDCVYQRWEVKQKSCMEGSFLGTFGLVYPLRAGEVDSIRNLSCWFNYSTKKTTYYSGHNVYDDDDYYGPWKNGLGRYHSPKLALLEITEVPCVKLEDGAKTEKTDRTFWKQPYTPYQQQLGKKKGTSDYHGQRDGTTTSKTGTAIQGFTERLDGKLIVHNPKHLESITIADGEQLVLNLMRPEDLLTDTKEREASAGEFWSINTFSLGGIKPIVDNHRTVKVGSDCYRQEITFSVDPKKLPPWNGVFRAGYIQLRSTGNSRMIEVNVRKERTVPQKIESIPANFTSDIKYYEANNIRYLLAEDWKHNDALSVRMSDILYIRNPGSEPDWNVQIVQHPIPGELWEKMPYEVRKHVDHEKAWYSTKDYPIYKNKTLMFKPLEKSAPVSSALFDALKSVCQDMHYPIATVHFGTMSCKKANTEYGVTERIEKLTQHLHIFLELRSAVSQPQGNDIKWVTIRVPDSDSPMPNYDFHVGAHFKLHLSPVMWEEVMTGWDVDSYPSPYIHYCGREHPRGTDIFKFRVDNPGMGCIVFSNMGRKKTVRIGCLAK